MINIPHWLSLATIERLAAFKAGKGNHSECSELLREYNKRVREARISGGR